MTKTASGAIKNERVNQQIICSGMYLSTQFFKLQELFSSQDSDQKNVNINSSVFSQRNCCKLFSTIVVNGQSNCALVSIFVSFVSSQISSRDL
jgi:hypothetical protein